MTSVGIRALKDNLSRYVRRAEAGERVAITDHGRVAAVLGPPVAGTGATSRSRLESLIAAGRATPPRERGDPLAGWPAIRLAPGTAAALVDADRGE
jgi:prevent-host-death family protein